MQSLLKLLDLVRRDLGAQDVRAEIGGRPPPPDARRIWAELDPDLRVVVTFAEPPGVPEELRARLVALLVPFSDLPRRVVFPALEVPENKERELDEELSTLAERTGALAAVVIDERSPVLWGTSVPRVEGWDVARMEEAVRLAADVASYGLDPTEALLEDAPAPAGIDVTRQRRWAHRFAGLRPLLPEGGRDGWRNALTLARAVHAVRDRCRGGRAPERLALAESDLGVFARGLAHIYAAVLVFEGPYSELHAEGPLVRVLPTLESLVLALPPVEPPPRGAKVIPLRSGP
ncbi:MAG: hypothetical protein ACFCGT_22455 [Sandaracinaceae bacterium]